MYYKRRNKFGAKRTGDGFPSKLEAAVYEILKLCERAGKISELQRQQTVVLQDGAPYERIAWKVDFSYMQDGELHFAEAKGVETPEYKIKLKLWRRLRPANLSIWKGHYKSPKVVEIILKNKGAENEKEIDERAG